MLYTIINNIKKGDNNNITTETWTGQKWSINELKRIKILFDFEVVEVSDEVFIFQGQVGNDYHQLIFIEEE